jgi:hypothetical protein
MTIAETSPQQDFQAMNRKPKLNTPSPNVPVMKIPALDDPNFQGN